jgi:peptide/nickel transport system ATP-binding protein
MIDTPANALVLDDLSVAYRVGGRNRAVLRNLNLTIGQGEAYGLVGESGCGKSTVALSVVRYLPRNGSITGGAISLGGQDVMRLNGDALRRARAENVSMVYQDPGKALNPSLSIARQLTEIFELRGISGQAATDRAFDMLRPGAHFRSQRRNAALPAPTFRRHAAARGDRHGAGE